MLSFELPIIFFLLPLPVVAYWLLPKTQWQQTALRVPFYQQLCAVNQRSASRRGISLWRLAVISLIWLLLVAAAAQPTWLGKEIALPLVGRDLMVAVDLSGSMRQEDMQINSQPVDRLTAVKSILGDFISRRAGDRIGLILFGSNAYVQTPLTFDLTTVEQLLNESQIGFAGEQTAIGDAIGLAVKRLRQRPTDRHVLVLLTDGSNNAGQVDPLVAARLAADNDIVIYTVGVGADEMIVPSLFGARRINPSYDLDEAALRTIAEVTGGRYFRARNPQELANIYQLLDQLEPVESADRQFRPTKALFYWPLGIAWLLSLLLAASYLSWGRMWLLFSHYQLKK